MKSQLQNYHDRFELAAKISALGIAFSLPFSTALMNITIALSMLFLILSGNWRKKCKLLTSNPAALLFLLFFAIYLIGMFYTKAPFHDAFEMLTKFDKFLVGALLMTLFLEARWRRYALNAFAWGVSFVILAALFKMMGIVLYHTGTDNSSVFKSYIATNFVLALFCFLMAHRAIEKGHYRWLYIALLAIGLFFGFFVNSSRTGYIIFFSLIVLFFWQHFSWKGILYGFLAVILLCSTMYFISSTFHNRVNHVFSSLSLYQQGDTETSTGLRLSFARNSLQLVKAHPIIGTGTGSFQSQYHQLDIPANELTGNPHDEYIHMTVQFGLVGLALLLLMFVAIWFYSFRLEPEMRHLAQGILLAIIIGSIGNSWLMDTTQGHLFVYIIAVAFAAFPKARQTDIVTA